MNKRMLALLLALVMAVSALPNGAWAAEKSDSSPIGAEVDSEMSPEMFAKRYEDETKITKLTSPKKGQLKISWKKVSTCTGYWVFYKAKGTKRKKCVIIKRRSVTSATIKGLKSKKTYEVYVMPYLRRGSSFQGSANDFRTIKIK